MLVGAGWALTVSFVILALSWKSSRFDPQAGGRALPGWVDSAVGSRWVRGALRAAGLLIAGWTTWAALAGPDSPANPTLGVFYIYLWVGMVPLSLLLGNVWPLLSPLRTLHLAITRLVGSAADGAMRAYPTRLGYWPAAVGLFAFVWTELVYPRAGFVSTVVVWCLLYAAVMLAGSAVFGVRWFERADPFEVWFGMVARLAVWGRQNDRLVARNPLVNLAGTPPDRGLVGVVSVLLGSTAYDSFSASNWWVERTSTPGALDPVLRDTVVLVGIVLVVALTFTVAAVLGSRLTGADRWALPTLLAHSLVPIAVGYVGAHYLTLLLESGQRYLVYLSDPLVTGRHDYLGTIDWQTSFFLSVRPGLLAALKVALVIAGHVLAVVAVHDRALRVLPDRAAVTGQLAMLVVMLGYTVGGLLLLFSV